MVLGSRPGEGGGFAGGVAFAGEGRNHYEVTVATVARAAGEGGRRGGLGVRESFSPL